MDRSGQDEHVRVDRKLAHSCSPYSVGACRLSTLSCMSLPPLSTAILMAVHPHAHVAGSTPCRPALYCHVVKVQAMNLHTVFANYVDGSVHGGPVVCTC